MTLTAHEVLVRPVISEKNTMLNEQGKYVFIVDDRANKIMIRQAVEELFNVKVTAVNVMHTAAKEKRSPRTRAIGRTRSWKKAVVTLAAGERIELFQGV
jgi:large subunit ribosomal protein L23